MPASQLQTNEGGRGGLEEDGDAVANSTAGSEVATDERGHGGSEEDGYAVATSNHAVPRAPHASPLLLRTSFGRLGVDGTCFHLKPRQNWEIWRI